MQYKISVTENPEIDTIKKNKKYLNSELLKINKIFIQ